jgi:tripartite-type tricarboxylate transporter receptor subunit TctC
MKRFQVTTWVLLALSLIAYPIWPDSASAKYPEKAVTVLTPHPAGGDTDTVARAIVEAARKDFPKGIAVLNRVGGGGTIGIVELVRAKPDGYTLASTPIAPLVVAPHRLEIPYKTANDYQPIIKMVASTFNLAVRKDKPWKNLQEFLAFCQANPGKVRVGVAAEGTIPHLVMARFARLAKLDLTIVPFTGGVESVTALIGGHLDANCQALSEIIPHVQAGGVRILLSFDETRTPILPDVPTAKETGFDMTGILYHSIIAPKGLPPELVSLLHQIFKTAMDDPNFRKVMEQKCYQIVYEGSEDLRKRLLEDYQGYGKLIQELGLGKK